MKALVTGGTGFVGGSIVRHLRQRGHAVRVLARSQSKVAHLEKMGVEISRGDILERGSISRALDGCDILFHAAAIYEFWGTDKDHLMKTEVEGTRNALEAALAAGVARVVYTSTSACVGERKGEIGTETTPHRGYFLTPYEEAKYHAEAVAKRYQDRLGIVVMRPAAVLGPGDLKPTGTGIINLINGKYPAVYPGALSVIHIEDVGLAHVLAAELERYGEDYILSTEILPMSEFYRIVCELSGAKQPMVIPGFVAGLAARFYEWRARRTGQEPPMTWDSYALTSHGLRVDGSKAKRELGLQYSPIRESIRQAIEWYWRQDLLNKKPACVE